MPPAKQQLDKAAWQWAEQVEPSDITQEHVQTAYRINLKPCKKSACRRNCKGNPRCLNALGQSRWDGEIDDKVWYEIDDPEEDRRPKGKFAGLKNLGATCYVNTFLQVWFHNPEFRAGVYQYVEPPDPDKLDPRNHRQLGHDQKEASNVNGESTKGEDISQHGNESTSNGQNDSSPFKDSDKKKFDAAMDAYLTPNTVAGHLQQIFALLEFSKRQHIDPTPFINSLGLDAAQQQDAQEFSKLLLSLLESSLSQQPQAAVRNLVQTQCLGFYQYITKCSKCEGESVRPSEFYELDLNIRGHKDLFESINEFLEEEKMEGDNQYMCGSCNSKQNAVRYIRLQSLPPVLNLQLLRFVFDRNTGHKKKLSSYLQFPESLDLGKYMNKPEGTVVYDLTAVLIHRGPSAYSGHYIAHIRDRMTDSWYKFNDEEINKMGGKNLQLGSEDDIEGKDSKKPKTSKGHHASRNAYMLVYTDRNVITKKPDPVIREDLSERLQTFLDYDTQRFEEWIKDMTKLRDQSVQKGRARQQEVTSLFDSMHSTPDFDWILASWLSKWTGADYAEKVPTIDNKSLLCCHKKVNPDKVSSAKCVTSNVSEVLYAKYGNKDSHRLTNKDLCYDCISERCHTIRSKVRIEEDQKAITASNKSKVSLVGVAGCYWVGKASLRSWKRLAMEALAECGQATKSNGTVDSDSNNQFDKVDTNNSGSCDRVEGNEEIEQGSSGKTVDGEKMDVKGIGGLNEGVESKGGDEEQEVGIGFNEDLLCEEHGALTLEDGCRKLVPGEIWQRLKVYFPTAPEYPSESEPCNQCLAARESEELLKNQYKVAALEQKAALSNLYHDKSRPEWSKDVTVLYVIPRQFVEEWRKFVRDCSRCAPPTSVTNSAFVCPHGGFLFQPKSIGVHPSTDCLQYVTEGEWQQIEKFMSVDVCIEVQRVQDDDGLVTFVVSPVVCEECCNSRQAAEHQSMLNYTKATIYIRKVTDHNMALSEKAETKKEEFEEEYIHDGGKRKKNAGDADIPDKNIRLDGSIRRSSRHRKLRGEKELIVSSTDSLKDLKVQIMKAFSVAPFDQNLHINGSLITADSSSTLASLNILPGTTIYLKADEPVDDPGLIEDIDTKPHTEEGFKGTGLLGQR